MNPIKTRGYTLIEILVAFAILGLLIAPISGVFNMIIKTNDISKNKTEIANIMNYAFESYLKVKSSGQNQNYLPSNYMGYDIEYNISDKAQYDFAGIRYDDYDAVIEINNCNAKVVTSDNNSYNINLTTGFIKLKVLKDSYGLKYDIYADNGQPFSIEVDNPKYLILMQINAPYDVIVDGIYYNNNIMNKNLTVKYTTNQHDLKLISIYPTVYFESNPFVAANTKQDIKLLTITIKKHGKIIDSKTFDITNRI